jgi:polysaccharide deacetylase family protein (PEP-CTERM system associated)
MALMLNALTVDLEDWYHPELVRHHLPAGECPSQIQESAQGLLDLFQSRGVKITFFVVGEVARRYPQLIQDIVAQGHELGCHGMSHKPLWKMTPDELRLELQEFARLMRQIAPTVRLEGFRAPTFSLDNRTRWALGVLAEFGYHYDSSVFPLRNPLYGMNGGPLEPYRPSREDLRLADPTGSLIEFPMSVWARAGLKLPVSGGFYLRALPWACVRSGLRQINQRRPFVIYFHPWETCPSTPRLALPLMARLVTYYNAGGMLGRIEALLDEFAFVPMRAVLAEMRDV